MKSVVSSFSMTFEQAMALKEATSRVKNRSKWINDAITAKITGADAFSMGDVSTRQIMHALHARICDDCPGVIVCPTYIQLSNLTGL